MEKNNVRQNRKDGREENDLEKQCAFLVINTEEPIIIVGPDLIIISFNKKFEDQFRDLFNERISKGKYILDYVKENTAAELKKIYLKVLAGEVEKRDYILQFEGRESSDFQSIYKPLYSNSGQILGLSITVVDITEKVRSQRLLTANENKYRTLVESISDAFAAFDKNLRYTYINKKAAALMQRDPELLIGKQVWEAFPDAVGSPTYEAFNKALHRHEHVVNTDYYPPLNLWHENHFYPSADGVSLFIRDISKQKETEAQLTELNQTLEKRAEELGAANAELEQFTYAVSHDLQEPLRMITSFLALLEERCRAQVDATSLEYLRYATDGAVRIRNMIMDLLDYSHAGKNSELEEKVDIREVLEDCFHLNRVLIEENAARLDYGIMPILPCNRAALLQVFQNLLTNALKYHRSENCPVIAIHAVEAPDHWRFAFQDNGIGIDSGSFDKIFVMFQRLHAQSDYSGTGIGLAICKKIIENHGGKIWVESQPEQGSTFYFTLKK